MIFSSEHVKLILEGKKTQNRRLNRGKYQVGKSYAIQSCRTCKGIEGYRIVIDRIWKEIITRPQEIGKNPSFNIISEKDASAEGGYSPAEYERVFRQRYPHFNEQERWAFEFHAICLADYGGEKLKWMPLHGGIAANVEKWLRLIITPSTKRSRKKSMLLLQNINCIYATAVPKNFQPAMQKELRSDCALAMTTWLNAMVMCHDNNTQWKLRRALY